MGREVKTLISSKQPAWAYRIEWNGTNNFGAQVASGYVRLQNCRMQICPNQEDDVLEIKPDLQSPPEWDCCKKVFIPVDFSQLTESNSKNLTLVTFCDIKNVAKASKY